jgi:hypothetical protein
VKAFLVSVAAGFTVTLCVAAGRRLFEHKGAAGRLVRAIFEKRWRMLLVVFLLATAAALSLITLGVWLAPSPSNRPPKPIDIQLSRVTVCSHESITVWLDVSDPDEDPLTIVWTTLYGSIEPVGPTAMLQATYIAPNYIPATPDRITATVWDNMGGEAGISQAIPIVVCSGSP